MLRVWIRMKLFTEQEMYLTFSNYVFVYTFYQIIFLCVNFRKLRPKYFPITLLTAVYIFSTILDIWWLFNTWKAIIFQYLASVPEFSESHVFPIATCFWLCGLTIPAHNQLESRTQTIQGETNLHELSHFLQVFTMMWALFDLISLKTFVFQRLSSCKCVFFLTRFFIFHNCFPWNVQ